MISQKQQERDFIVRLALVEKLGPVSRFKLWRLAHEAGVFDFEKVYPGFCRNGGKDQKRLWRNSERSVRRQKP